MLRENPQLRPNIFQVVREVCMMRGTDIPIKDVRCSAIRRCFADSVRYTLLGRHQRLEEISNYQFRIQTLPHLHWLVRIR